MMILTQFGQQVAAGNSGKNERAPTGRSAAAASAPARRRPRPGWLLELLAVFELKGSCQTKPQAVQPHSLEIMGERGGGPREKSSLCFERKKLFVPSHNANEKKRGVVV